MATKRMYRCLSPESQSVMLTDWVFGNLIELDTIDVEFDDTVTPEMNSKLIEGLNKKITEARANIHLWEKMICELDCLEHKPEEEFEEYDPTDREEYFNGN